MIRFRPLVLLLLVRRPRGRWTIQMNRHIVRSPRLPKRCQCRPRLNEHCMIIKRSRHPPKQAAQCTTATHQCTPLTSPCSNHKHNHSLKNASLPTARPALPRHPPPSHSAKETVYRLQQRSLAIQECHISGRKMPQFQSLCIGECQCGSIKIETDSIRFQCDKISGCSFRMWRGAAE